jgi:hypothetical protein
MTTNYLYNSNVRMKKYKKDKLTKPAPSVRKNSLSFNTCNLQISILQLLDTDSICQAGKQTNVRHNTEAH